MPLRRTFQIIWTWLRQVPWPCYALGIALWLLICIQEVAEEVMEGDTHAIDTQLIGLLRAHGDMANPIGPHWIEEIMRDVSALGGIAVLTLVILGTVIYLLMQRRYILSAYVAFASIFGTVLSNMLKALFDRPRPDFIPHDIAVYTASFPSGHAMMSAVVYLTLGALLAEAQDKYHVRAFWMMWALFLTFIIGFSRVYLGVHWPSDVLAGWMTGLLWALLCWLGLKYIERKKTV